MHYIQGERIDLPPKKEISCISGKIAIAPPGRHLPTYADVALFTRSPLEARDDDGV